MASKVVIAVNNPQGRSTLGENRDVFSKGLGGVSAIGAVTETKMDVLLQVGPGQTPYGLPQEDPRIVKSYEVGGATWLMVAQPAMIKRPVLEFGDRIEIGFKPERYAALFPK